MSIDKLFNASLFTKLDSCYAEVAQKTLICHLICLLVLFTCTKLRKSPAHKRRISSQTWWHQITREQEVGSAKLDTAGGVSIFFFPPQPSISKSASICKQGNVLDVSL